MRRRTDVRHSLTFDTAGLQNRVLRQTFTLGSEPKSKHLHHPPPFGPTAIKQDQRDSLVLRPVSLLNFRTRNGIAKFACRLIVHSS